MHPGHDQSSDSGYGSGVSSPNGDKVAASSQAKPQTKPDTGCSTSIHASQPRPLEVGGTQGLKRFEKEVDQATIDKFQIVVERLQGPLLSQMRRPWQQRHPTAIRLMVLGKDETDAKPWIVVLCAQDQSRRIKRFFQQKFARAIYCPEGPAEHQFEVLVIGQPPRTKASDTLLDVYGGLSSPGLEGVKTTSCGTLLKVAEPDGARFATLGGIIKVVTPTGGHNLYGLTAGHILDSVDDPAADIDAADPNSSSEENMPFDEEDCAIEAINNVENFGQFFDLNSEPDLSLPPVQNPEAVDDWAKIGTVTHRAKPSHRHNRDWTLIKSIDRRFLRANHLVGDVKNLHRRCKELREPCKKTAIQSPKHVIVNSEVRLADSRQGVLSNLPTMVLIPPGRQFVRVYPLSMDGDAGMSGSLNCPAFANDD